MINTMFSPVSLEAQKLISVSIGKINASRVTRTGTSLHKSLLVASVLQRARNVYLDEERERAMRYPPQCPPSPPEVTVTPVTSVISPPPPPPEPSNTSSAMDKENRLECYEDNVATPDRVGEESRLPLAEANTGNNVTNTTTTTTTVTSVTHTATLTTTSSSVGRKRRRVSDQETAAAVSSILPKRLRSELKEDCSNINRIIYTSEDPSLSDNSINSLYTSTVDSSEETRLCPNPDENSTLEKSEEENNQDSQTLSDSDDSEGDDSASDTSTSSSGDEMEVDQLTSLVSYFSFSTSQKQSEFCLGPIHHQSQSGAAQIVALTA